MATYYNPIELPAFAGESALLPFDVEQAFLRVLGGRMTRSLVPVGYDALEFDEDFPIVEISQEDEDDAGTTYRIYSEMGGMGAGTIMKMMGSVIIGLTEEQVIPDILGADSDHDGLEADLGDDVIAAEIVVDTAEVILRELYSRLDDLSREGYVDLQVRVE